MYAEDIETKEQQEKKTSFPYLLYVFGIGVASIILLAYWGYTGFSFYISVVIGGFIQVLFRTTKRMWSNSLNYELQKSSNSKNPFMQSIIETLPAIQVFASLFAIMVVVSSLWYGLGMLIYWLLN